MTPKITLGCDAAACSSDLLSYEPSDNFCESEAVTIKKEVAGASKEESVASCICSCCTDGTAELNLTSGSCGACSLAAPSDSLST